jgi:HAD superfamily hydrolase (TIGR01509 family)
VRGRGLFLDLDGTLADTLPALRRAYARVVAEVGGAPSQEEFAALDGLPFPVVAARLHAVHAPAIAPSDFVARYREVIAEEHKSAAPSSGALELLAEARALAVPVAVVTSGPELLAREWLRATGLTESIAAVVGWEETPRGKPAPDPYLAALTRTGCSARASLAVEDSQPGARAALAAGLETWVLTESRRRAAFPPECRFVERLDELCARLRRD